MVEPQKCLFDAPSPGKIAETVADIIQAVKSDNRPLNNAQLAVKIGVSKDTIDRLEGGETAKVPASVISGIAAKYGLAHVQPYMRLFGCRAIPLEAAVVADALGPIAALTSALANIGPAGLNYATIATILKELRGADDAIAGLRAAALGWGLAA